MQKFPHPWKKSTTDDLVQEKRLLWMNAANAESDADIGQKKIKEYRSAETAKKEKNQTPDEMLDGYNAKVIALAQKVNARFTLWKKSKVKAHIDKAAKNIVNKVKTSADGLSEGEIEIHTNNALTLLKAKEEAAKQMSTNLSNALQAKRKLLANIDRSILYLSWLGKGSLKRDLKKEIISLDKVKGYADVIRQETKQEIREKSPKIRRIKQVVDGIVSYAAAVSSEDAPVVLMALERAIRTSNKTEFLEVLSASGIDETSGAYKTISKLLDALMTGEKSKYWPKNFTANEVKDYFITQVLKRNTGNLNVDSENVAKRAKRIHACPLGQRIVIDADTYYLIRKDEDNGKQGSMLKKHNSQLLAYICVSDGKVMLTKEEAKENGGKCESPENLQIDGGADDKTSICFKKKVNNSSS